MSLSSSDVVSLLEEFVMKYVVQPPVSGDTELSISHPRVLRVLRPREVCLRTTLSVAHIHRLQQQGRFPRYQPYADGPRGLLEHVLDAWFWSRIATRANMCPLGSRPALPLWQFVLDAVPAAVGIRFLRRREVLRLVGFGTTHLYRLIVAARFPGPVSLGKRAARWVAYEVQAWLRAWGPSDLPGGSPPATTGSPTPRQMRGAVGGESSDRPPVPPSV